MKFNFGKGADYGGVMLFHFIRPPCCATVHSLLAEAVGTAPPFSYLSGFSTRSHLAGSNALSPE